MATRTFHAAAVVAEPVLTLAEIETRLQAIRQKRAEATRELELEEANLNRQRAIRKDEERREREVKSRASKEEIQKRLDELERLISDAGFDGGLIGKIETGLGWNEDIEVRIGDTSNSYGWNGSNC